MTSETANRPPGRSTRAASASTLSLVAGQVDDAVGDDHVDRRVGQRDVLDVALEELDVVDAGVRGVRARQREHLVGHVEPDRPAGRSDAAGGDEHVRPAARAEVEHGLALVQVRHGGRARRSRATPRPRLGAHRRRRRRDRARRRQISGSPRRPPARRRRRRPGRPRARERAAAYRSRTVSRMSPSAQPQAPPVPQQSSLSPGSQHVASVSGAQQFSSAMSSVLPGHRGRRSSTPTGGGARPRRGRHRRAC